MNLWHFSATTAITKENYQEVVEIYENLLNDDPQNLDYCWYLGLAYLYTDKQEEAKTTWLIPFLERDDSDELQKDLLQILHQEAKNWEEKENYPMSWLVRQEIREIQPEDLNNLLLLLCISGKLKNLDGKYIHEWNLASLIQNTRHEDLDFDLIIEVLDHILIYPYGENLDFIKAILSHGQQENRLIKLIFKNTHYRELINHSQQIYAYKASVGELCLEYQPNNLEFIKEIFWDYVFAKNFDQSTKIGQYLIDNSTTAFEKTFGTYFVVYSMLAKGDWLNASDAIKEYKILISNLVQNLESKDIPDSFRFSFCVSGQTLLYLEDNPQENRQIINKISSVFQTTSQSLFSCPVHLTAKIKEERKLKIGYIGHTMRVHSVGWLSRWLMKHHDQTKFSIYNYYITHPQDEVTKTWFSANAEKSVCLPGDPGVIVTTIQKDEIDILVDLDSFTLNVTAIIMALKPAPVQVSWLGMDSMGLPTVDYFIADPFVLSDNAQEYYQEKIWRLPHTYLGVDGFEVDVPSISRQNLNIPSDGIIYLNIQNALKRHPDIIHSQMKIIKSVPNSYLLIKGNGDQEIIKQLYTTIARAEGVDESQLRFLPRTFTEAEHRGNLAIADIVLDTYPYNGATTTLETLWMEVPMVTRVGEQFAARNSYTFMMNAGITEGIAQSEEEYIKWGIQLGMDENLRKEISWKLRQSKNTSPLWNGKQFAREMEKAYQQMWDIYLSSRIS